MAVKQSFMFRTTEGFHIPREFQDIHVEENEIVHSESYSVRFMTGEYIKIPIMGTEVLFLIESITHNLMTKTFGDGIDFGDASPVATVTVKPIKYRLPDSSNQVDINHTKPNVTLSE